MTCLSISNWIRFALLALVAVTLIEDSLAFAWACHSCDGFGNCSFEMCTAENGLELPGDSGNFCYSRYSSTGTRRKFCMSANMLNHIFGGSDQCVKNISSRWFHEQQARYMHGAITKYQDRTFPSRYSEDEYVKEKMDNVGPDEIYAYICYCSKDNCNTDENDKTLMDQV